MRFTGYRGPYQHGMPTRQVADDGSVWRAATPEELAEAPGDLEIYWGTMGTSPGHVSDYAGLVLSGNYPLLPGIAALRPVWVRCADGDWTAL